MKGHTMSHFTDTLADINGRNAFQLTTDAECMSPDARDSAGATFLLRVRNDVTEAAEAATFDDASDWERLTEDNPAEIADNAVPVYTYPKWQTFVDLGAWQEDLAELGYDGSDLDKASDVALYMIAERLAVALIAELREAIEEDDAEGGDDNAEPAERCLACEGTGTRYVEGTGPERCTFCGGTGSLGA